MLNPNKRGVSPVIAIVLLLMMTVAAAGAAYFWITSMQSSVQQSAGSQIEAITKSVSTRVIAQATICKPTHSLKGLVGYWELEEGSGNKTRDHSLRNNTGTLKDANTTNSDGDNPPDWTSGKVGQALDFDGTDDYVELTGSIVLDDVTDLTVTAWARFDDLASQHAIFATNYVSPVQLFYDSSDNRLRFKIRDSAGNRNSAAVPINSDTLYYIAGVFNEGTIELRVYDTNGLYGEDAASASTSELSTSSFTPRIGSEEARGKFHNGTIDEARIYDRALSKDEIEYFYELGKDGWHLGNVSVTVYNAGAEAVPEGTWVANLKKGGNIVDSDTYNASKLDSEERATLNFYFSKLHPGGEYTIELEGTQTSTTVSC